MLWTAFWKCALSLCMCMCVCVCVCLYVKYIFLSGICTHVYVYNVFIYTDTHTHIYAYTHIFSFYSVFSISILWGMFHLPSPGIKPGLLHCRQILYHLEFINLFNIWKVKTKISSQIFYVRNGGFRRGRGTRDQIANICWIIEKAREFQKSIYFCFIDYAKAFDCVDHNKLWKILKEMGIWRRFWRNSEGNSEGDHWPASWETYMQVRKQQLDIEQQTGSK